MTNLPVTVADLVVQLSAIRTVLREAHFALDDSEDLSHLDEPVHAVPLDNVMRLHRALKTCERFAPKDEAWEGPGPLVTQIIEQLGVHLAALTAYGNPKGVAENKAGGLWYRRWHTAQTRVNELEALLANPPKHKFWGAGEPDCPREVKAPNGELHTLRCKACGLDNPRDDICRAAHQGAGEP